MSQSPGFAGIVYRFSCVSEFFCPRLRSSPLESFPDEVDDHQGDDLDTDFDGYFKCRPRRFITEFQESARFPMSHQHEC